MSGCTTYDCDNPVDPNGFIRLNDCDCLGDPDVFPNCRGHTYCTDCTQTLVDGGEFNGCVRCSSSAVLTAHGGDVCRPLTPPRSLRSDLLAILEEHAAALEFARETCRVTQNRPTWSPQVALVALADRIREESG